MQKPFKSISIAEGITFSSIIDSRFKTNRISINLVTELAPETVTVNALIPQILQDGFAGCENFTLMNRRLQELYGASMNTEIQKRGDSQILSISVTGIDDSFALDKTPITAEMAQILCDLLLQPLTEENGFSKKYTELEKNALSDTIDAQINDKRSYALSRLAHTMCSDEPYGLPKYGFKEKIGEITPHSAKEQYDFLLQSSRIEIIFTGCGSADKVIPIFQKAFSGLSRHYQTPLAGTPHPVSEREPISNTEEIPVSQAKMVLGFAGGSSPKSREVPAMRLMTTVLGGSPSSKLFANVREKLSLCYYCAARYDSYKGIMIVDSGVEEQNIEKAKSEILIQLADIQNGNITDEEFQSAVLHLENAYSTIPESDYSLESFYLGQILMGLSSTPETEKRKIQQITKQDIVDAAKRLKLDTVYVLSGKGEA